MSDISDEKSESFEELEIEPFRQMRDEVQSELTMSHLTTLGRGAGKAEIGEPQTQNLFVRNFKRFFKSPSYF